MPALRARKVAEAAEEEVAGRLRLLEWAAVAAVVGRRTRPEAAVAQGHLAAEEEEAAHRWVA